MFIFQTLEVQSDELLCTGVSFAFMQVVVLIIEINLRGWRRWRMIEKQLHQNRITSSADIEFPHVYTYIAKQLLC
jgi:hypothetical protein